jgi:hypothetical protein
MAHERTLIRRAAVRIESTEAHVRIAANLGRRTLRLVRELGVGISAELFEPLQKRLRAMPDTVTHTPKIAGTLQHAGVCK